MNVLKNVLLPTISLIVLAFAPLGVAWSQVKVTAATPSSTVQGTISLDVVVSGSGFDSTSKAQFFVTGSTNPGGITVKKTVFRNSKEIVATIDVADTANIANFDIQVTLDSGRKGKGTTLFTVQKKFANIDPCTQVDASTFPAFTLTRPIGNSSALFVSDANGVCQKQVTGLGSNGGDFRFDPVTRQGLLISTDGLSAALLPISTPTDVQSLATFATLIVKEDLPYVAEAGWAPFAIYGAMASPDGTQVLFNEAYQHTTLGTFRNLIWICPLDLVSATAPSIDKTGCVAIHDVDPGVSVSSAWGARAGIVYLAKVASSGSGRSLYRITVATRVVEELWSRGTDIDYPRATLRADGAELLAVFERSPPPGGCSRTFVIDADTCAGNSCSVLNGQGSPAYLPTWLLDGRVAGGGQTGPDRKGKCSGSDAVVAFDPTDANGIVTTLTTGRYPNGAGGGQ